MSDLFNLEKKSKKETSYSAHDIEVLEGLEPVRRRPGMYIGGVDENALHHLVSEVLDNSMDEAVAGHATYIEVNLSSLDQITITDNGRGIPIDPHPKFPNKSALEVILTTLHSGGKFSNKSYQTAGGLHGVGVSVVNALSEYLSVEVAREGKYYTQEYKQGAPITEIALSEKRSSWKRGTSITFRPDVEIFGENNKFDPARIYNLLKTKAYLFKGVVIKWECASALAETSFVPLKEEIHFPNGISDYLRSKLSEKDLIVPELFKGDIKVDNEGTKLEWVIAWSDNEPFIQTYCNTIPTPLGGTHEQGVRAALIKSFKTFAELSNNKKIANIIIDDILLNCSLVLSVFIHDPIFQGQTKEKLLSGQIAKIVENTIKDRLDHWLISNKQDANIIFERIIESAEERLSRKQDRSVNRKTAVHKLRLPGKLADCSRDVMQGTELFIVEGDSAGGSAKQARNRETQAILPLRGKILNVATATNDKILQNQELIDLEIALACGSMKNYNKDALRYEKVIIMTDADVDGAHIASLLMTFFYRRMPKLISGGHLFIAQPPLYRITQGSNNYYAASEEDKNKLIENLTKKSKTKIELGRFKGLGEMTPPQLKETTMCPKRRKLIKLKIENEEEIAEIVENLMGKKPHKRFEFINEQALTKMDKIVNNLDI